MAKATYEALMAAKEKEVNTLTKASHQYDFLENLRFSETVFFRKPLPEKPRRPGKLPKSAGGLERSTCKVWSKSEAYDPSIFPNYFLRSQLLVGANYSNLMVIYLIGGHLPMRAQTLSQEM